MCRAKDSGLLLFFFFFFLAYAHTRGYNMFRIGDKVKVISKNNDECGRTGKVTILKDWSNGQQIVRVAFSANTFDYTDVLSWGVKKV